MIHSQIIFYFFLPRRAAKIFEALAAIGLQYTIVIEDLGILEQQERQTIETRRAFYSGKTIDLENYHTYEEVVRVIVMAIFTLSLNTIFTFTDHVLLTRPG